MLLSKEVPGLGSVYHPLGAGAQFDDLIEEIDEYFAHGISLAAGDVVFDVGANIGAFALQASRHAGGPLEMYCFEPIPPVFAALEKNFAESPLLDQEKSHLFPLGLTSLEGPREAVFHYFKRLPCDTTQHIDEKRSEFAAFFRARGDSLQQRLGQRIPGAAGRMTGKAAASALSGVATGPFSRVIFDRAIGLTKLRCPLSTIEDVVHENAVSRIDLLKIDVEGAEYEVLLGIGPKTWPRIRQVVLEGHDKDGRLNAIKNLLQKHGFDFINSEVPPLAIERGLNNFILHAKRTR